MIRKSAGFTLMELIVTIIILGILAVIAYPSYRTIMQNMRVSSITNDFMATLAFARAEALARGSSVSVCAAADTSDTSCGSSANWNNGWIVFLDPTASGTIGDPSDRLKTHDPLQSGGVINTNQAFITYSRNGFALAGMGNYTITTPSCSGNSAQLINISNTGRADVTSTACTLP
jgi:type IV fimbrial biogenesis protein FimT